MSTVIVAPWTMMPMLALMLGHAYNADASIMPDCIWANTNVATMVIGERIADFMRQGS